MKECKAGGMYGDVCKGLTYCLLGQEFDNGETTIDPQLFEQYNCPPDVRERVMKVWGPKLKHLEELRKKAEQDPPEY